MTGSALSASVQELRHLARARAQTVQRALPEDPDIGPDRLFLVEAATVSPKEEADAKRSRDNA